MIIAERTYCTYCRGELLSTEESDLGYHIECRKEFKLAVSDFELFDELIVRNFKEKCQKRRQYSLIYGFIAIVLWFCSIFVFIINWLVGGISFIIFSSILVNLIYIYNRTDHIQYFCKVLEYLKPNYMYLSEKYCIALIGEIYLVNNPGLDERSKGFYVIKFIDDIEALDSKRLKIPSFPFPTSFNNTLYGIRFARLVKKCRVRHNSQRVMSGLASIYCIKYKHVKYQNINQLVFYMNRERKNYKPKFAKDSIFILILEILVPVLGIVITRLILVFFFK